MKVILGTKVNMSQRFVDSVVVPVTVVQAGPCTITQVKGDKDGYQAIQLGFGAKRKLSLPLLGHLKGLPNFRYLKEFRLTGDFARGQKITVGTFAVGDTIQVSGWAKGKGFQGVVKRHHFAGAPKSHGHKDQLRMPGSIGPTEPKHVFKGTRMGGRMGGQRVTVKNLEVVEIDEEKNLLYIKGAVPGGRNMLLLISGDGDLKIVTPETPAATAPVSQDAAAQTLATEASKADAKDQASRETAVNEEAVAPVAVAAVESGAAVQENKQSTVESK